MNERIVNVTSVAWEPEVLITQVADLFFLLPSVDIYCLACFMRTDLQSGETMKQKVDDYLRHHGLGPLFEVLAGHAGPCAFLLCSCQQSRFTLQGMTAALLLHKPAEPCKFLAEYLAGLQNQGAQPALTREELRIMFGMFDVTEKGTVSVAQANQVTPNNSLVTVWYPCELVVTECTNQHVA